MLNDLAWNADGLLPVVIADARTGATLTLAYANREALEKTITTRSTHLYSRSRGALWEKGATSGNKQRVKRVAYDCDADALLYEVVPAGPACHTGAASCFFQTLLGPEEATDATQDTQFSRAVSYLSRILEERKSAPPDTSYVATLYAAGVDRIGKKVGEEAVEVVIAAKNDDRAELVWEVSDLLFHLMILLKHKGISLDEIGVELLGRIR